MLTDDQIAELRKLLESRETERRKPLRSLSNITEADILAGRIADAVPALLDDRALLVAVAEAAEKQAADAIRGFGIYDQLRDTLAAWRAARDGSQQTKAGNVQSTAADPLPEITPENFFTRVFHDRCPKAGTSGIMKRHPSVTLIIEDGSFLTLWECLHCGVKVYAGLDSQRRVVRRAAREGVPASGGAGKEMGK